MAESPESAGAGALAGVRVLDCTDYIAGPYAGMMLADLGADVIKVESLEGDRWRQQAPVAPGESRNFMSVNRGKRDIALNLRSPDGVALFMRLLEGADVLLSNFRPGVAERLGLGYEQLAVRFPRLIYADNTAFGAAGPDRDRAGFDLLLQATAGVMDYEGKVVDGIPLQISTVALADVTTATFLACGVVGALYARTRTGRGQRVSTSLLQSAIAIQYRPFMSVERTDAEPRAEFLETLAGLRGALSYEEILALRTSIISNRPSSSAGNNYYRVYRTSDGFLAVACLNNGLRRHLRDVVGADDPAVDGDTYNWTSPERRAAHDRQRSLFEAAFRGGTTVEWMARLDAADVPCAPMRLTEEIFDAEQVQANEMMLTLDHRTLGALRQPAGPIRMSDTPFVSRRPPPILGQDTDAVLAEAGCTPDEIADLRKRGVVK